MILEITIPSPGESITEVELANWLVSNGDYVDKDQEIAEVESDKATLPLIAGKAGKIEIRIEAGETVAVGTVACTIDTDIPAPPGVSVNKDQKELSTTPKVAAEKTKDTGIAREGQRKVKITPLAKKMMEEKGLSVNDFDPEGRKITSKDVRQRASTSPPGQVLTSNETDRAVRREKMSALRRKLGKRLVAVKNETAMLTTFNEADMSRVLAIRKKYKEQFIEKHGIKLGLMSFFIKASALALKEFPNINSMIDGEEIIVPGYVDISIAVQTDKGLMVPVIRNTETLSLAQIEHTLKDLADKARRFRLSIEEMEGGTFTITNGGVFGSMLSTPILNPPQSGILGMHNIQERPVVIDGKIEIRPMMYLALSYDHRIVDGRDSVSFLVRMKEFIEDPVKMIADESGNEEMLLEL